VIDESAANQSAKLPSIIQPLTKATEADEKTVDDGRPFVRLFCAAGQL
jgi:hypothetical protein